ncbi:MAG: hypothetical protein KDD11_03990, partial [Acidobacteria bacterium]|nr:hypothetical protein [Acidobacteriota bacterium]
WAEQSSYASLFSDGFETGDGRCWTLAEGSDINAGTARCPRGDQIDVVYSSDGLLHAVTRHPLTGPESTRFYLYLAGRPVAQLDLDAAGVATPTWLTTDHLGTPVLATNAAGAALWQGGFEPFGADYSGASLAGVDLRFPGQWVDGVWEGAGEEVGPGSNVHRWLSYRSGRYTRVDPLGLAGGLNSYVYALSTPAVRVDPFGRQARGDAHLPSEEELDRMVQRSCARQAFYSNYQDMREANWKLSDKYFHCKANCEATKCGDFGYEQACEISDGRELFDQLVKRDPPSASIADQAANHAGRKLAKKLPNLTCQVLCAVFRPKGLPPQY